MIEIYKLPWRRIYTTNYDNAIEFSRKSTRNVASFTLGDSAKSNPDGAIIHINGFIESVSPQTVANDLILTDHSYATSNFEANREWSQFFRNDLRLSRAVVFLGYSLSDLDVARILISEVALRSKTIFFIGSSSDEVEVASLEPYGEVIQNGFDELLNAVTAEKKIYSPSRGPDIYYSILDLGAAPADEHHKSAAIKIYEQLVYGTVPLSDLMSGARLFGDVPFSIPRPEVQRQSERVLRGEVRDLAIVGGLASGKTFAALQVAQAMLSAGYKVYWVLDSRKLQSDLDRLRSVKEKVCLIVDGYARHLDDIRDYVRQRPSSHTIVATERSANHEIFWGVLRPHLMASEVPEIALDSLGDVEIEGFEELINFAGLWSGDLAGRSANQRMEYISKTLDRSLYRLLLEVLKSKKVRDEIKSLLAPLRDDRDVRHFFTTAFIVGILGYNFWINDWQAFYSIRNAREVLRKYANHVAHFVLVDSSSIRPRSGVASLFMLQNYIDDETIAECLVDILDVAVSSKYGDSEFERAQYDLMRYNFIEPLFSDRNKLTMMVKYYEGIRGIGEIRNNADYWLQLGIACTISGDYDAAQRAFDNAYAREKAKQRANLVRIDNYFARFQMEKAAFVDDSAQAFKFFKVGVVLLLKQIFKDDNRHYPFKAGRSLTEIAAKHYDHWPTAQKAAFVNNCKTLLLKAEDWRRRNKTHQPDVLILIREAGRIVKQIESRGSS